jgi:hypothetical protein
MERLYGHVGQRSGARTEISRVALLVTAYAWEPPDEQWPVMLINKDHDNDHAVKVVFADSESKRDRFFSGPVDRITFGAAEYQWHAEEPIGRVDPDGSPSKSALTGGAKRSTSFPGIDHRHARSDWGRITSNKQA